MYIYSGVDIIRHPTAWFWALRPLLKWFPASMQLVLGTPEVMTRYLFLQGTIELILAFILLAWFLPKFLTRWAALITTLEFAGIILLIPIDAITFRDIGLLGAALALWLILLDKNQDMVFGQGQSRPTQRAKSEIQAVKPQNGEPLVETFEQFMQQK